MRDASVSTDRLLRLAQLIATGVLFVAVIVFGWIGTARMQATLDFQRLQYVRVRLNETEQAVTTFKRLADTDSERQELAQFEADRDWYKNQLEQFRAKYPEWFLPRK